MISVCMATYNGERFIREQIDSILPQLSTEDELIISDDGSTDGTLGILAGYTAANARVKVLHHVPNSGYSGHERATANFENALRNASGEYIFLADQDDVWHSNKVSICIKELEKCDFVVHGMNRMDCQGKLNKSSTPLHIPKNWVAHILRMRLYGCCMAFRKKVLSVCLPFPKKLVGHDYWISALTIRFCTVSCIQQPLINYREHSMSVSQNKKSSCLYKVSYRAALFFMIIRRIQYLVNLEASI
ncbi:MAG: glycosyltransferase [Treponemataceae bacterium]|nr:glycosyltransferase [Treponemataceae bacterium]